MLSRRTCNCTCTFKQVTQVSQSDRAAWLASFGRNTNGSRYSVPNIIRTKFQRNQKTIRGWVIDHLVNARTSLPVKNMSDWWFQRSRSLGSNLWYVNWYLHEYMDVDICIYFCAGWGYLSELGDSKTIFPTQILGGDRGRHSRPSFSEMGTKLH